MGFPSGQREQTVNLPSSTSKVRILPPPPLLPDSNLLNQNTEILCSAHAGKDEKLRLRFDSSASEKALPQATTRRARRSRVILPPPPSLPRSTFSNLVFKSNLVISFCFLNCFYLSAIYIPAALRLAGLQGHAVSSPAKRSAAGRAPIFRYKKTPPKQGLVR